MSNSYTDLLTGPYQMLPLGARVDLRIMAMKGYDAFPKLPRLESHHQISLESYPGYSLGKGSYSPAEMQSVHFTAPVNLAERLFSTLLLLSVLPPIKWYED